MLFNKDNRGSEELYNISGIYQAGSDYTSIAAEVDSAKNAVSDIIGIAIMQEAEQAYEQTVTPEDKEALVKAVQLPVAYLAIAMHAQLSLVTHGDTGRKIKKDDNETIPFAWQIDRDDKALRERYYRALDALFRFLDNSDIEAWKNSAQAAIVNSSIIKKLSEFESIYPLEHSNYMFHQLLPLIIDKQNTALKQIIGEERLSKLVAGEDVDGIRNTSIRFVALKSLIVAIERWSVDAFPLAIARRFSPNYQGNKEAALSSTEEVDWYLNKLNLQAQDAALELQTILSGNPYENMKVIPENDPKNKYFTV